jgi:hypothetical protein
MSVRLIAARRRREAAARSAQHSFAASRMAVRRVWAMSALLAGAAALLYVSVVSRLALSQPAIAIPWVVFAAMFCIAEARRVHVHFRRNAHSFSLSEIPLVLGLYFASPQTLVSSRFSGALVALSLIRRQPPAKAAFNLSLYAFEAEVAMWLISVLEPLRIVTALHSWAVMLAVVGIIAMLGFSLTALLMSLAEGSMGRRQLLRGYLFSVGAALVNACLAIQAAAAISRNLAELWLLGMPLLGVAAAFFLYTSEHQKRQRIQHLYECSDLLQRSAVADAAVPELLAQISQVFRGELAEVVLLPIATGTGRASTTTWRHGQVCKRDQEVDRAFLEGLMMAIGSETRARGISWADSTGNG